MHRMTDALSRMLNDPSTQAAMRSLRTGRETTERSTSTRNDGDSDAGRETPEEEETRRNGQEEGRASSRAPESEGRVQEEPTSDVREDVANR